MADDKEIVSFNPPLMEFDADNLSIEELEGRLELTIANMLTMLGNCTTFTGTCGTFNGHCGTF